MITVNNVCKKYGSKCVVSDVCASFAENSLTSIIGPNGAGKSTLLSIMSRLIIPDSGSIMIDGKIIEDWDKQELSKVISILKQENRTEIKITVYELVSFGRFPYSQGNLTDEDTK
ncbi:MAG: ATP-binding cassette domain-containing protein, partial [Oscillospiraceae bacterium]